MTRLVCHDEKRWIGCSAVDVNSRRLKAATFRHRARHRTSLSDWRTRDCSIHLALYQTILIIRDIRVIGGFCYSRGHKFSL